MALSKEDHLLIERGFREQLAQTAALLPYATRTKPSTTPSPNRPAPDPTVPPADTGSQKAPTLVSSRYFQTGISRSKVSGTDEF